MSKPKTLKVEIYDGHDAYVRTYDDSNPSHADEGSSVLAARFLSKPGREAFYAMIDGKRVSSKELAKDAGADVETYEKLSAKELKAEAKERGIEFDPKASKAVLVELLEKYDEEHPDGKTE